VYGPTTPIFRFSAHEFELAKVEIPKATKEQAILLMNLFFIKSNFIETI
jgi:hypothetical protein